METEGLEERAQEFFEQQTGESTAGLRHEDREMGISPVEPRERVGFTISRLPESPWHRQSMERRPRRSTADYDPSANVSPYGDNFFAVNSMTEEDRQSYRAPSETSMTGRDKREATASSVSSMSGDEEETEPQPGVLEESKTADDVDVVELSDDSDEDMGSFTKKMAKFTKEIGGQPFDPEAQIKEEDSTQQPASTNDLPMQLLQRPVDILALYKLLDTMDVLMCLIEEHGWDFANQNPETVKELYDLDPTACDYLEDMLMYWNNPPEYPTLTIPPLEQSGVEIVTELWDEQPEQEDILVVLRKAYADRLEEKGLDEEIIAPTSGEEDLPENPLGHNFSGH